MNFELINIVAARTSVIIKIVQTPIGDAVFAATKDRLFLSNFVDNYVSREGKSELVNLNKVKKVEERISNLYTKIRELKLF